MASTKVEKTVIHFKNGERAEISGLHDPFAGGCGRLVELKNGDDSQKHSITFLIEDVLYVEKISWLTPEF